MIIIVTSDYFDSFDDYKEEEKERKKEPRGIEEEKRPR